MYLTYLTYLTYLSNRYLWCWKYRYDKKVKIRSCVIALELRSDTLIALDCVVVTSLHYSIVQSDYIDIPVSFPSVLCQRGQLVLCRRQSCLIY